VLSGALLHEDGAKKNTQFSVKALKEEVNVTFVQVLSPPNLAWPANSCSDGTLKVASNAIREWYDSVMDQHTAGNITAPCFQRHNIHS